MLDVSFRRGDARSHSAPAAHAYLSHMPASELTPTQYRALREQIQGIISEGGIHTRQAGEWEKVETYWHIGDALISHIDGQPRAEYGRQIVVNLSKDIQLSQSLLWHILRFRRVLTILSTWRELSWSHIREIIYRPSREERRFYLSAANRDRWNVAQLQKAIRDDLYGGTVTRPFAVQPEQDAPAGRPLRARFGEFHVYKIVPSGNPASHELYLDLGFHMTEHIDPIGLKDPAPDLLVTSKKRRDGVYAFNPCPPQTRRHTYIGWPHRIIDGDTLIGVADCGLGHHTWPLRWRLRGIDTPELGTFAGRNAKDFVVDVLSQVSFVVISTFKTDNYGRFLVDLKYLPGESDPVVVRDNGTYLNRQLLTQRLATRWQPE